MKTETTHQWLRVNFHSSLQSNPADQWSPIGSETLEHQYQARRRRGETDEDLADRLFSQKNRNGIGRRPLSRISVTPWA